MQTQLAAARSEMARGGRVSSHLVSKVMAEWDKRRLVRVVIGWRAEVVRRQFMRSDAREEELKHSEQRLTNSSLPRGPEMAPSRALEGIYLPEGSMC